MNKTKKIFLKVIPVFLALMVILTIGTSIYATGAGDKPSSSPVNTDLSNIPSGKIENVDNAVGSIWGTVVLILQVVAIGAIIFAGVRYMFASADAKADIKKQTLILVLGAILVFGATTLVGFLTSIVDDVANTSGNI